MNPQPISEQGKSRVAAEVPGIQVLRFRCMHCGRELTAPPSAAGVRAPCPVCGVETQAPELPAGPQVEPAARPPSGRELPEPAPPAPEAPAVVAAPEPRVPELAPPEVILPPAGPEQAPTAPVGRRKHRSRGAMAPGPGHAMSRAERAELAALLRIVLAVALTLAITLGVFHFVKRKIQAPSSKPVPGLSTSP